MSTEVGAAAVVAFERELALQVLRPSWTELARSEWERLAGLAVAADRMPQLLATLANRQWPRGARTAFARALYLLGGAGRRWHELLRVAGVLDRHPGSGPLDRLWPVAAASGWPAAEVARLRALAEGAGVGGIDWEVTWSRRLPADWVGLGDGTVSARVAWPVPLPDGRTALATLGGGGCGYRLWDPVSGQRCDPAGADEATGGDAAGAGAACRLPDGRAGVVTGGRDGVVRLWDALTGDPVAAWVSGHTGSISMVCSLVTPDGRVRLATGGDDGTVRLHTLDAENPISVTVGAGLGRVEVACPVPLPDGRVLLATGGYDPAVRLWDPIDGRLVCELDRSADGKAVTGVAALTGAGGRSVLVSTCGRIVRLHDPVTEAQVPYGGPGHDGGAGPVAAVPLPDGRVLLAVGLAGGVALWDPELGEPVSDPFVGVNAPAGVCALPLPDGQVLVGAWHAKALRLWDLAIASEPPAEGPRPYWPYGTEAASVVTTAHGRSLVVTVDDDDLRYVDPDTWQQVGPDHFVHEPTDVCELVQADGRRLLVAVTEGDTLTAWDAGTWQPAGEVDCLADGHSRCCPLRLPDGRVVVAVTSTNSSQVCLVDPVNEASQYVFDSGTDGVSAVCRLSLPDGCDRIATGDERGTVRIWDPATGAAAGPPVTGHTSRVWSLCQVTLAGGRVLLASGSDDGMIRLWDPHALTPIGEPLTGHDKDVDAMCQLDLPDGRPLLVSGDSTGTVRLWDPQRGTIVDTLRVTAPVVGLGVLDDGRLLVATSFPAYTFRALV